MPNPADAYTAVIASILSAKRPKPNSAEAAMEQVQSGSSSSEAESRYFDYFQKTWRQAIAEQDLAVRVVQCIGLYVSILSRWTRAEEEVGVKNTRAMKAAFLRLRQQAESETLSALVANPQIGATTWGDAVNKYRGYLTGSVEASDFASRISRGVLDAFATRAAATAAKGQGISLSALRAIADGPIREIVFENRQMFLDGAQNGVMTWNMPIGDADNTGALLGLGNDLIGGVGSVASGVASLELGALAGAALGLNVVGLGLVVVAAGFALAAYLDSVKNAEEAVRRQRLEALIKTQTVEAFSLIADGITAIEDSVAMVCAAHAMQERINLRAADRDSLRRFIWQYMFPKLPTPTVVAVTAIVRAEMDARINPIIVGA
jgi:hypothetical protein